MPANSPGRDKQSGSPDASPASRASGSSTSLKPSQRNPFRSLLSTAPPGEEMADVRLLPLDLIDPNPYQARQAFDLQSLEELASSIKEHGVIEPIVVRRVGESGEGGEGGERYEIVAGERRHRASAMAGEQRIPARIMELDPQSAAIITALENLQREDLDIEDEARQFAFLLEATGLSQRKLAAKLGIQFNYLSRRVRLLKRPDLMEEYRAGRGTLHQVLARLDVGASTDAGTGALDAQEAGSNALGQSEGGEAVSAGYSAQDTSDAGETDIELIEREDLPGFVVSRGYSGSQGAGPGGNHRSGAGGADGGRRGGARFRWRPVQQFYNWVGRTRASDIPADERATVRAQLTEIKEALEKQLADLDRLGHDEMVQGQAATAGAGAAGDEAGEGEE